MQTQMKGRIDAFDQQALVEFVDGMGGAMNEKDLETKVIGQQTQVGVEDVHTLILNGNIEKQMQANVDIGETSTIDVNRIEVELQKIMVK